MVLGGILERTVGLRMTCLIGCWCLSAGVALTYWSLKYNYVSAVVTYGVMFGLGCGIAYSVSVTCVMRWFPKQRGLMGGLVLTGFGIGSSIFNPIITVYLNPENIAPDHAIGEDVYFTQNKVLDRVPNLFLILGAIYASMQLIGIILMVNPPPEAVDCETVVREETGSKILNKQTDTTAKATERTSNSETTIYSTFTETDFPFFDDLKNDESSKQNINHPEKIEENVSNSSIQAKDPQPAFKTSPGSACSPLVAASSVQPGIKCASELHIESAHLE